MKLLFSEWKSDYATYTYPYVVWGMPEAGETAPDFFERGLLPAAPDLSRYYVCRNVRVDLAKFQPSSENRRILRKGQGIACELVPRSAYEYSETKRAAWKAYADQRFGEDIMSFARLDRLMSSPVISHLLVFREEATGAEIGTVLMYVDGPRVAYYYYAFFELGGLSKNLGMFMMTAAVERFATEGFAAIYLGTCYSERALYKTQFPGVEFFNGACWSSNLDELKYMVRRELNPVDKHAFETPEFLGLFWNGSLEGLAERSGFKIGS
jgi:arginyl-tRNA--protein-N-Asp/Glu arginylyltransferase